MAIKLCLNCNERFKRGVSGFDFFPKNEFDWCSDKCLFIWLLNHEVTCNGEYITSIERHRDKAILDISDCLDAEALRSNVPQAILIKVSESFKKS